jgi:Peptidase A4 family
MGPSGKGLYDGARANLSALRCGKQSSWPTNILEEKMRNKLFMEITGRLCAGVLFVAIALFSRSTLVMAGGMAPSESIDSDQSIAQAVIIPRQPPPGFNPIQASDKELESYGYPPRPPQSAPKAYGQWRRLVSVPRGANPHVTQTKTYNGPFQPAFAGKTPNNTTGKNQTYTASLNWSGYADVGPVGTFTSNDSFVIQYWIVPKVQQAFGVCNGVWDYSSQWAGFDGYTSSDALQAGTEADAYCGAVPQATYYTAWIEWYPNPSLSVSIPPIQPGDYVAEEVWYTTSSPQGNAYIVNFTENIAGTYSFNPPAGTTFAGDSAEWIEERPGVYYGLANLSNYVTNPFNNNYAYNNSDYFYPDSVPSGITNYDIWMFCTPSTWVPSLACSSAAYISVPYVFNTWDLWFYDYGPAYSS